MPTFGSVHNPADMTGVFSEKGEIFSRSLASFAGAMEFDTTVMIVTVHPPSLAESLADHILDYIRGGGKPIAVLWVAGDMSAPARLRLREAGVAVFEDADRCMRALAARARIGSTADSRPLPSFSPQSLPAPGQLTEADALSVLSTAGVPVARSIRCATPEEAAEAARSLSSPVVVKVSSPNIAHKSDIGGVVLGVAGPEEAAAAHAQVVSNARTAGVEPEGTIVQSMVPKGFELFVGARRDPGLGTILVVGMGGIGTEVHKDVSRRLLPLQEGESHAMLQELRSFPLLAGVSRSACRGHKGCERGSRSYRSVSGRSR